MALQPMNGAGTTRQTLVFTLAKDSELPPDILDVDKTPFSRLRSRSDVEGSIDLPAITGMSTVSLGPRGETYVFMRLLNQRNLYRIPLQ